MKLPLDFGIKLFFRLLMPGFCLAIGMAPILCAGLDSVGLSKYHEAGFVICIILTGWIILIADMPIYMFVEGRRYWPSILLRWFHHSEIRRLNQLDKSIQTYYASSDPTMLENRRYLESSVDRRAFPIDASGDRYAACPTRLGNAIMAFETYPATRYGIDAIFYWPRIWIHLNKDLRDEIDNLQGFADSAVYTFFCLGLSGILWLLYGLSMFGSTIVTSWAPRLTSTYLPSSTIPSYLPAAATCIAVAIGFFLFSHTVYCLSLYSTEQFGILFMAVIDAHAAQVKNYLGVDRIVAHVAGVTGARTSPDQSYDIARRYLQYFNVKLPGTPRPVTFPKAKELATAERTLTPDVTGPQGTLSTEPTAPLKDDGAAHTGDNCI